MPTTSVENYLKAIYHLEQRQQGLVKNKAIAARLEISLPSVTAMLKSLADDGLVDYTRYKGVSLSELGRTQALKVIRKHRLVELFLVNTLDYSWDEVHSEAEMLEHAISDELAMRIDAFLNYPVVDPHGDPIPNADGELRVSQAVPLTQCTPPCFVQVARVLDQSPELLRYLQGVQVIPGQHLMLTQIQEFDGQVHIHIDDLPDETITLTRHTASKILVKYGESQMP